MTYPTWARGRETRYHAAGRVAADLGDRIIADRHAALGDVHGDAWTARLREQHATLGAKCPCGNGHDAEPDPAGDDAARDAAERSVPTLAETLGATVDRRTFEGGTTIYVTVPGFGRQTFTAYYGDDETAEQKAAAWLAFCRDFNASSPKG